jgi:hypothetical protein
MLIAFNFEIVALIVFSDGESLATVSQEHSEQQTDMSDYHRGMSNYHQTFRNLMESGKTFSNNLMESGKPFSNKIFFPALAKIQTTQFTVSSIHGIHSQMKANTGISVDILTYFPQRIVDIYKVGNGKKNINQELRRSQDRAPVSYFT